MKVLLLGGKGLLGTHLEPLLNRAGHDVTAASRSTRPPVDLTTGAGLASAVAGAEAVVHLASDARRAKKVDLAGTRRLLSVVRDQHLIYVSIVGVDRHPFSYYRVSHKVEQLISDSGARHTIIRATQFHDFLAYLLSIACKPPVAVVPKGFIFQPIDVDEVAEVVAGSVGSDASGLQEDLAGPEVLGIEHLARSYMEAVGRERPLLPVPVFGRSARSFRDGLHTNPLRTVGVRTWDEYLDRFRWSP